MEAVDDRRRRRRRRRRLWKQWMIGGEGCGSSGRSQAEAAEAVDDRRRRLWKRIRQISAHGEADSADSAAREAEDEAENA